MKEKSTEGARIFRDATTVKHDVKKSNNENSINDKQFEFGWLFIVSVVFGSSTKWIFSRYIQSQIRC